MATIRENVAHISRGCRSSFAHNPAVHEQAIDRALAALDAELAAARETIRFYRERDERRLASAQKAGKLDG